jgi:hypothetical protein
MAESTPKKLARFGVAARAVLAVAVLELSAAGALADNPQRGRTVAETDAPAASAPVEVIFTGFARRTDKGASIFVRMTGEVPVVEEQSGRRLVYRLTGAKLGVKNNANPLPTGSFGPPVVSVALVAGSASVDVVIDLTSEPGEKAPTYRVVSQSGIATLIVELPPATE